MLRKTILAVFALMLGAISANAAPIFVSQSGGTFSGGAACNGQSTISIAAFNAGTESAGQVYEFCGAITTPLSIQGSGASGKVITFLWDTGARISVPSGGIVNLNGTSSFLLFDGGIPCGLGTPCDTVEAAHLTTYAAGQAGIIEATANGSPPLPNQAINTQAFYGCSGCHDIEARNLIVRNLYVHSGLVDVTDNADTGTFMFQCAEGNNGCAAGTLSFHDMAVHDLGNAISFEKTSNTTLSVFNVDFWRTNWAMENSGDGTRTVNFHDNACHDPANWDTTSDGFHHNCLHNYMNTPADSLALNFYNNYSFGNWGTCCTTATLIFTESDAPANFSVFNNVDVQACDGETAPSLEVGGTIALIANNTLIGCPTTQQNTEALQIVRMGSSQTVRNNVIQGYGQHVVSQSQGAAFATFDYDIYGPVGKSGNSAWACNNAELSPNTFAGWQASPCAGDPHGQNPANLGVNATGQPQAGSMLVGAGTNLTANCAALPALCSTTSMGNTIAPVARTKTGAWTPGAFAAAGVTPPPPTNAVTMWGVGPSSTCAPSVAGGPAGLCIATDGVFTNAGNGAPWIKFAAVPGPPGPVGATGAQGPQGPAGAGGVISFNGQTGAVTYVPPVVSVNGKTGAVVIAAITTLQ
jgi:hypothetical protein